ncbi:MAG: hypothetical protein GOVbin1807_210 [Prokaryotic dsDNA virus sp.]|nr:MAG: hypothetical protein GOVbin1807_210 [Prokaryotic dsDNA virus sp.]
MAQEWKYREHKGKQGRFRIGDLVQLSAYGKSTDQNTNPHFDGNELGLIIEIGGNTRFGGDIQKYPIVVQWINVPKGTNVAKRFFFRELKLKRT